MQPQKTVSMAVDYNAGAVLLQPIFFHPVEQYV